MDRYEASVLKSITDKGGPFWTVVALMVLRRGSIVGLFAGGGGILTITRALGWW